MRDAAASNASRIHADALFFDTTASNTTRVEDWRWRLSFAGVGVRDRPVLTICTPYTVFESTRTVKVASGG